MPDTLYDLDIQDSVSLERSNIYWSDWPGSQAIAEAVRGWGIAVFPGFLQGETISALNAEFDQIIDIHKNGTGPFQADVYDNIVNVRLQREHIPAGAVPVTSTLFAHNDLKAVSDAYFGDETYTLNKEIFVSDLAETTTEQTKPPFADHFDKLNLFKFFFYLSDTDETNGAMRAAPGSNKIIRAHRLKAVEERRGRGIDNIVHGEVPSLPIIGPAGTLFIFDTDVAHGAGKVSAGKTRRTMRGHCTGDKTWRDYNASS
jgi:ectoine hydroxylase-related dioxygenase (phytanoyl-CoA dioxygenase family)